MVMKKRKMPPHIVLPNGMWRFVKKGAKSVSSLTKPKRPKKTKRKGVNYMARRRSTRKSYRRSSGLGSNKLMNGFFPVSGFIQKALVGAAASELSEAVAPKIIPYQNLAVAGAVGGVPGVAGAFLMNMLQGKGVTNSTNTSITFY